MNRLSRAVKVLLTIVVFLTTFGSVSYAEEQGIGYEISPIFSSNQIDKDRGYYYVQTEPGKKQTLDLALFSTSDEDKELEIAIENAISSTTGDIDYSENLELIHESLANPITEILKPRNEIVTLKAREEAVISLDLTPPKNHYDGVKMGRIVVREKQDEEKKGVTQVFQYALGVITSENGLAYNDGSVLEIEKVQANVSNGTRVIEGFIYNPEPKTIENLKVTSYVTKKGESTKIKERNIDNFAFAPNSKVTYTIPWGLREFESGEYTFHYEAKNDYETFNLVKDFTIRGDDAKRLNSETAFAVQTPFIFKVIIVIMNVILVGLFVFIILRDKRWIKELRDKKKKKNRNRNKKRNKRD